MEPTDNRADIAAISSIATGYYWAMVHGNGAELRRLFDSRAPIVGHYQGEFLWLGLDAFIEEAQSLIGQHGLESCSVESVRVDGEIGTVAIKGHYAGQWFLDHLSLVKVDDRWVIAAKTFRALS